MLSLSKIIQDILQKANTLSNYFSKDYLPTEGQELRVNKEAKIIARDPVMIVRAGANAEDIKVLSTKAVDMNEIFSNWDRISVGLKGIEQQNMLSGEQLLARNSYYYDREAQAIVCSRNSDAFSAFISNEEYGTDWMLKYMMDQRIAPGKGSDDDALICVVAYMVDKNDRFHTITLVRAGGQANQTAGHNFVLAYDLYTSFFNEGPVSYPEKFIILEEAKNVKPTTWYNNYCYCQVERTPMTITCKASDTNQDAFNEAYTFTWTLPSSKPSDWSQEAWDNINYMMSHRSKVGFGTMSNISAFKVVEQHGLFDEITVYNFSNNKKETYKNGQVIASQDMTAAILPKTLIYSLINDKLFYYRGGSVATEFIPLKQVKKDIADQKAATAQIINKDIKELQTNAAALQQNIQTTQQKVNKLSTPLISGENGQIMKSDGNGSLAPGEIFMSVKMAGNTADLQEEMKFTTVELSEILNNWKRFTHSYGPSLLKLDWTDSSASTTGMWSQQQNNWEASGHKVYLDKTQKGWTVNKQSQIIMSTVNGYPVTGFISPTAAYENYRFKCKIDTGGDNDNIGIIVGYMVDKNGREHTLTVMRGSGHAGNKERIFDVNAPSGTIDTRFWWGLIYDAGNDSQDFLVDMNSIVGADTVNRISYVTAIREGGKITAKTTPFSLDGSNQTNVDEWTFTYELPEARPENMSEEEYENIKKMMTGKNHVGFCARSSSSAAFSILEQEGLYTTMDLFDLTTNTRYLFDANTKKWVNQGDMSTQIPNRTFLFSERSKHLYYYAFKGNYTQIF